MHYSMPVKESHQFSANETFLLCCCRFMSFPRMKVKEIAINVTFSMLYPDKIKEPGIP